MLREAFAARNWDLCVELAQPLLRAGDKNIEQMVAFALKSSHRFTESLALYQRILQENNSPPDVLCDYALALQETGAWDEAQRILEGVYADKSVGQRLRAFARYKLGWHRIRNGEFELGMDWNQTGRRLQHWGAYARMYSAPMLKKTSFLEGKTVLVVGEAGCGDEIINVRFCRYLKERGAKVIYQIEHQSLIPLFTSQDLGIDRLTVEAPPPGTYHFWVAAQDLPVLLNLRMGEYHSGPYFKKPQTALKSNSRLRIGLKVTGDPETDKEQGRRLPQTQVEELISRFPQFEFHSFENYQNWQDTAAALSSTDLLISSCTGIVHLAGALGVKTYVLTQPVPYYVWATETTPSPWYSCVTAIKKRTTSWDSSFARLHKALTELS